MASNMFCDAETASSALSKMAAMNYCGWLLNTQNQAGANENWFYILFIFIY